MSSNTNQLNGAEAFVRMLQKHDVTHVFGLCGDTSLPLYDALARLDHGITHVLTRDERSAAYMADCYARVSGKVGICEGPSGGGATYILPGVVEAHESSIPLIAVTTDISVSSRGKFTLTELDQESLFRPISKWTQVIDRGVDIPAVLRRAFKTATSGRPGGVHLGLPFDVQKQPVDEAEVWADRFYGAAPSLRVAPDPDSIARAAAALASAKRPVFVCGGGVVLAQAEPELARCAAMLGAAVCTTVSGQGAIPDSNPLHVGVVGSNGGVPATRAVVTAADLVVFVGCRAGSVTTERWRYPAIGTRIVHIDVDPGVMGATYPTEVAVVGDAKLALAGITTKLERRVGDGADAVRRARAEKEANYRPLAISDERPIKPERLVADLASVLPDDAVVVCDPGTPCPYFSCYYPKHRAGRWFISNRAHGALGYALPGSVGAWYGRPSSKIVAVSGDGSFGFACGELETIARQRVPLTMIVISNSVYGWIKAGQKTGYGGRYFSVDFSRTDHAAVAAAFGIKSWKVEDPAELKSVLKQATEYGGPTLVDVITQPLQDAKAPVSEWVA
jgi:acetolactate synthase-1/2/3 large subunit